MERALKLNEKKIAIKRMNCILRKAPIGDIKIGKKERLDQDQPENLILTNATDKKRKDERQDNTRREKKRSKFSAALADL